MHRRERASAARGGSACLVGGAEAGQTDHNRPALRLATRRAALQTRPSRSRSDAAIGAPPPHCAHTARGVGRDASIDGAWRRQPGVRRSIDIPSPAHATLGPYGAHRTPLEPVPRAKANGPFQRARACCGPLKARAPLVANFGAQGRAGRRGARRRILLPPRTVRAPPLPRAPLRTSASSRRALSQSPNTLRSGSCRRPGARGASTRSH